MSRQDVWCSLRYVFSRDLDWQKLGADSSFKNQLHGLMNEMGIQGERPNRRGFTNITRIDDAIGGLFVVEANIELLDYERREGFFTKDDSSLEHVFFVFFVDTGEILVQNKRFQHIAALRMERVIDVLKQTLQDLFTKLLGRFTLVSLEDLLESLPKAEFLKVFREYPILQLKIETPAGVRIPETIEYYNPQRERNRILRQSQQHDIEISSSIRLEAREAKSVSDMHFAQGVIEGGNPTYMKARIGDETKVLRAQQKKNFRLRLDISSDRVEETEIKIAVEAVREEYRRGELERQELTRRDPGEEQLRLL